MIVMKANVLILFFGVFLLGRIASPGSVSGSEWDAYQALEEKASTAKFVVAYMQTDTLGANTLLVHYQNDIKTWVDLAPRRVYTDYQKREATLCKYGECKTFAITENDMRELRLNRFASKLADRVKSEGAKITVTEGNQKEFPEVPGVKVRCFNITYAPSGTTLTYLKTTCHHPDTGVLLFTELDTPEGKSIDRVINYTSTVSDADLIPSP